MRNRPFLWLSMAYSYLLFINITLSETWLPSAFQAAFRLTAMMTCTAIYVSIYFYSHSLLTVNIRLFGYSTILWILVTTIFLLNELVDSIFRYNAIFIDWMALLLMMFIFLLQLLSFMVGHPFWYLRSDSRLFPILSFVLLPIWLLMFFALLRAFWDLFL
jgi:hypothetical protein